MGGGGVTQRPLGQGVGQKHLGRRRGKKAIAFGSVVKIFINFECLLFDLGCILFRPIPLLQPSFVWNAYSFDPLF